MRPDGYRGPFATIGTRTPGLYITELLPKLAQRSHLYSVIRSNINRSGGHPDAGNYSLTGYPDPPAPLRPNFGSIVARHRGGDKVPPFISLGRGKPRDVVRPIYGYGGGEWGQAYDPFQIACSETGQLDIPALKLLDGLSIERLGERQQLAKHLDRLKQTAASERFRQWDHFQHQAIDMLTSPNSLAALDMSRESDRTRQAYGQTTFGQSCLLARRLVEASVPYIQVNWSEYVESMTPNCDFGWDTHIYNFDLLPDRHCPILDRALSALLDDLHDRRLLESTLVVAMGEFGRTPKINGRAARDHWPNCYFSLWAGGGTQPGRVIGASDRLGQEPATNPVDPVQVGTTIVDLAGVDSVARAELNVLRGGTPISELL